MLEARKTYDSDSVFLNKYIVKYDCIIGSRESIDYLMKLEKKECQQ